MVRDESGVNPAAETTKTTGQGSRRRPLPRQTEISRRQLTIVVIALALGGFGIGTTEFVSMGLLNLIATDFGISEDAAGHLISVYALGVMVGAPLIAAFTGGLPRRRLLLILMAFFTVGNGLSMLANNYETLLLARFIAGLPHGAFFSVSGLCVASMAGPKNRGKAISLLSLGFSVATLGGVPLAQFLGQTFGWNAAYSLVTVVGVVTTVALWFFMPHMTEMKATSPLTEIGALARSQVWLTLAMATVGFGGMFAVYTYISWTLTDSAHAGMNEQWVPLVLMIYGFGSLIGGLLGGWIADRNLEVGLGVVFAAIGLALVAFYFLSSWAIPGTLAFAVVGLCGSALIPNLQIRLMDVSGDAQTFAASLMHSALNLANATGAAVGGAVIGAGYSYTAPSLAGAGMAALALIIWLPTILLRRQQLSKAATASAAGA